MESNPFIRKTDGSWEITPAGEERLARVLTNPSGNIYAFYYQNESPLLIAAAMARLSRRGDDLRITYLDEFAPTGEEDASSLIHRVVTAFGDDSVQQLVGLHLVVEDASNLLTKLLEWGRFAAYLEQSTRYIFYDTKDANGHYKYIDLPELDQTTATEYRTTIDSIFDTYSEIVRGVTKYVRETITEPTDKLERTAWLGATRAQACDAARPVLPVATKSTVGIFASAQAVESLILHLLSEPLLEAQVTGRELLTQARKVIPAFLERADIPERGGATTAYRATTRSHMRELAAQYLKKSAKPVADEEVRLVSYWPEKEVDLIPEILFTASDLSLEELKHQTRSWSRARQREVFMAYCGERLNRRHKPGRALELAHYEWEITADYGCFRDLQRHRVVDAFEWQDLTPQYGYIVPELITKAGFEPAFRHCFELSGHLYDQMTAAGFAAEAQYATLLGHRMRYRFMLNARASFHLHELRTSPQGHPGYRRVVNAMHDQLRKVHPLIAEAMKFVNQGEDPALARLAAERATQYRLQRLDKEHSK